MQPARRVGKNYMIREFLYENIQETQICRIYFCGRMEKVQRYWWNVNPAKCEIKQKYIIPFGKQIVVISDARVSYR